MLRKRRAASREFRNLFQCFDCFDDRSRPKHKAHRSGNSRTVAAHQITQHQSSQQQYLQVPKDRFLQVASSTETVSQLSYVSDGIALPTERSARQVAKANNASFYNGDLQTDDDIRLLRIEPGDGPFRGVLQDESLLDPPDYDSLSYCWGEQSSLRSITINGKDGFQVSQHLESALLRLRRKDRPRLVWVDVICVNQARIVERNRSVGLMWRIYTAARRVIIWIGEVEPDRASCKRLYPATDEDPSALTLCAKPGLAALEHGNLTSALTEILRDMEFESIKSAVRGEVWWKRLWVVQEFSCSRELPTVYLGPHAISWTFFSDLMVTDARDRLRLFHTLRSHEGGQSLFSLLLAAKMFHCSDPRDRIYALLGLATQTAPRIVPDYSKSVINVYEEATLQLILEEQNLDVLLDDRLSREDDTFPTWVPNFEMLRDRKLIQTMDGYTAGQGTPQVELVSHHSQQTTTIPMTPVQHSLRIRGIYFDHIVSRTTDDTLLAPDFAHRPIMARHFHQPALSEPLQTAAYVLDTLHIDYTVPTPHGLDRLPCVGYLMLEYLLGGTRSVAQAFSHITKLKHTSLKLLSARPRIEKLISQSRCSGLRRNDALEDDLLVSAMCESVFLWCRHKRSCEPDDSTREALGGPKLYIFPGNTHKRDFFSTANGFIGLGSASLEVDDHIVVPFGASRPFILRQQKDGFFTVIGDAVLPGVMSGQLMNLWREGSIKEMEFSLR